MDIDASIDKAIIDTMAGVLASPPAISRPFFDVDGTMESLAKSQDLHLKDAEKALRKWLRQAEATREELRTLFQENPIRASHLDLLTHAAEAMEAKAEGMAKAHRSGQKAARRQMKEVRAISPSAAPALEANWERTWAIFLAEVDDLLAMALFMRALRAEHDPETRNGPVFNNAEDVSRYLNQIIAT